MSYRVKLKLFDGPFDLLVYLIEHAQMSIYDIKIAEITTQYMEYIQELQNENIAVSSEFMVLAAELLEIKSKMLLPRSVSIDEGGNEVYEDPRTELFQKLREYKQFKAISAMLEERRDESMKLLEKPQEDLNEFIGQPDEYLSLGLDEFSAAFEMFLRKKERLEEIKAHHVRTKKQRITTELRMADIKEFFVANGMREADFRELIHNKNDKYDVSVTFSSLLEMMKEHKLDAEQKHLFGDITVKAMEDLLKEANDGQ